MLCRALRIYTVPLLTLNSWSLLLSDLKGNEVRKEENNQLGYKPSLQYVQYQRFNFASFLKVVLMSGQLLVGQIATPSLFLTESDVQPLSVLCRSVPLVFLS